MIVIEAKKREIVESKGKITQLDKIAKPEEEFVYPPDDTYIPTNGTL